MAEFILPLPPSATHDHLEYTKVTGSVYEIYDGYFKDASDEFRVTINTKESPHVEDGELFSDKTHEVIVYEESKVVKGVRRQLSMPGEMRYPFSERLALTRFIRNLIAIGPTSTTGDTLLEGPTSIWRE